MISHRMLLTNTTVVVLSSAETASGSRFPVTVSPNRTINSVLLSFTSIDGCKTCQKIE